MADTLIDGNFRTAESVGAPRWEYPFRNNGDRVSALFEQDYWQRKENFTPAELVVEHPTERGFWLVRESPPVETIAGLYRFTRMFARVPARQTEWSSILVPLPDPGAAGGGGVEGILSATAIGVTTQTNAFLFSDFLYALGAFHSPLKASTSHAQNGSENSITYVVPNHNFSNSKYVVQHLPANAFSLASKIEPGAAVSGNDPRWAYVNANAVKVFYAASFNYGDPVHVFSQYSRGSFGTGTRYLRCRRVTDYYLPGVTPGITTEADIPLPADQSGSEDFITALLAGTGDINVQVGELQRWRETPIYQITKTVIDVLDLT